MATPRQGWRTITVDDSTYRWTIRREPKYWDNHGRKSLRFIVESKAGSLLVVQLNRPRLDYWWPVEGEDLRPVTPAEVILQVRQALQAGWNPKVKTRPYLFKVNQS